jgi:uncharacterized protein YkwD
MPLRRFVSRHGRGRLLIVLGLFGCAAAFQLPGSPAQPAATTSLSDYGRIEGEVIDALNRARTSPASVATDLDALTRYFSGKLLQRPGQQIAVQTAEGVAAVREAASAARSQAPVSAVALSSVLSRAARDQAVDQARTGATGHVSADGSTVDIRVKRYGTWSRSLSENIEYSSFSRGAEVIENLLVDDGVPDRGHRKNIYDPTARVVGVACGPHPKYGSMCVIVQAGGFTPK